MIFHFHVTRCHYHVIFISVSCYTVHCNTVVGICDLLPQLECRHISLACTVCMTVATHSGRVFGGERGVNYKLSLETLCGVLCVGK